MAMSKTVTIPLDVAVMVRNVFLPLNPNKMRDAAPSVVAAAHAFKVAVAAAESGHGTGVPQCQYARCSAPEHRWGYCLDHLAPDLRAPIAEVKP